MTIEIEIKPGLTIIIDEEDKRIINKYKWHLNLRNKGIYTHIQYEGERRTFTIARTILYEYGHVFGKDELVCYKDKNFLNNSKSNFIINTPAEYHKTRSEVINRGGRKRDNGLPYGVYLDKRRNKFRAMIKIHRRLIWLGEHKSIAEAEQAVSKAMDRFGYRRLK